MKKLFALAALVVCALPVLAQENYATWSKYRVLTLNTTPTGGGANTSGNVRGFPVLVRLTSSQADVFAQAKAAGADIRFTKANGTTRLAHEIEQWDSAGQSASIWVRLDTAFGNNSTQTLRLYWGMSTAADSSSGANVFRTGENYQGVWHFKDMNDATTNANNGTNTNTTDTAGLFGRARYYNGTSAYVSLGNSATMNSSVPFTIEGWVKWASIGTSSTTRYRPLMTHGTSGVNGNQVFLQPRRASSGGTDPYYSFGYYTGSNQTSLTNDAQASALVDSMVWTQVTGAYDGTNWNVYRNGVLGASVPRTVGTTITNATTNWFVGGGDGNAATTPSRFYFGAIDEVRFSDVSRDSNWIRLAYETQKAGSTALAVGTTQTSVVTAPSGLDYSSDTAAYGLGLLITPNVATVTGGIDSFTVSPALPAGLSLNKGTGAITGTPTVLTAAANYVLTAINTAGTAKDTLRLSVVSAPPSLNYASSVSLLAGAAIAPVLPSVIGTVDSFTVAPALPGGLSLNKTTGALSGTPAAASAAASFVITGTNVSGTGKDTISITVVASEDYLAGWNRHKTLWLNTSNSGAAVTGTVTNFPVLVRFTTTDTVYSQMLSGTADLRFTKSNGTTRLPHQIEQWDSAGKSASVWVLVDTVLGGNITQTIRMHWGRAAAQNLSVGRSVFDTAKGFRAVFHFGEGTSDTALDASSNGFKAIPQRTATTFSFPEDTVGAVGRARRFGVTSPATTVNSTGSYFVVAGSAAPLDFPQGGPYTLSTWVIVRNAGVSKTFISKSDRSYSLDFRNTGADWEFAEHNTTAPGWVVAGSPAASAGAGGASTVNVWTHIMGVRGGGTSVLYVNGVAQTQAVRTDAFTGTGTSITSAHVTTTDLNIGRSPDGTTSGAAPGVPRYYWRGVLDEVRLAQIARSADWAKLEYENQKAAQTLVSQTQPVVGIAGGGVNSASVAAARLTAKAVNGGVLFQVAGTSRGGKIALMDLHGRTIWSGAFPAGTSEVRWRGVNGNGQAVSGGVYLARVTLPGAGNLEVKVPFAP